MDTIMSYIVYVFSIADAYVRARQSDQQQINALRTWPWYPHGKW
jgi:hypothetical protein